ncbi:MAG: ATP-grasp domain-containing protein [Candidatus Bathyarchaeota archaeon]|nr:ATP-grasp domain-containing protein [Candidatus Bathyarchaeota archaeon]MDH5732224.1 ATP-grasp domain-containing protein [Candidatus Bathyarchaeota archaeon]
MHAANLRNVLVIGLDVVSLAASAKRAGYHVYAADFFGDQDLKPLCQKNRSIIKQRPWKTCGQISTDFNPAALLQLARALLKMNAIDAALLSSGLDDSLDVLFELNDVIPILGNHPNVIQKVRDKMRFFQELKRLGIPHPETAFAENYTEARDTAKDVDYPVLIKPSQSFGGAGIRKAENPREFAQAFREASFYDERVLIQKYISGTPASASLISSANGAVALTLNEQLLGVEAVGQEEPFGYCGNIVPLVMSRAVTENCKAIVERIAARFGLVGSNGVDFVISQEGTPYVIEVNPRFQGTLECVERVLGINIVKTHVQTCSEGTLPTIAKTSQRFCSRLILFAPQRSLMPDLTAFKEVSDIPLTSVIVEKGEPVCSIVAEGAERLSSFRSTMIVAESIRKLLLPVDGGPPESQARSFQSFGETT